MKKHPPHDLGDRLLCSIMASDISNKIRNRLSELGITANAASTAAGLSRTAIGDILSGKSESPRANTLEKIAKALKCDLGYLMGWQTAPVNGDSVNRTEVFGSMLPILGIVEAGVWREAVQMVEENEFHPAAIDARFPEARQYFLRVRGDSMDACSPAPIRDGDLIHCVDFSDTGLAIKSGMVLVVHRFREDGGLVEATVKRAHVLNGRIELRPESRNKRHQPIIWDRQSTSEFEEIRVTALVLSISNRLEIP